MVGVLERRRARVRAAVLDGLADDDPHGAIRKLRRRLLESLPKRHGDLLATKHVEERRFVHRAPEPVGHLAQMSASGGERDLHRLKPIVQLAVELGRPTVVARLRPGRVYWRAYMDVEVHLHRSVRRRVNVELLRGLVAGHEWTQFHAARANHVVSPRCAHPVEGATAGVSREEAEGALDRDEALPTHPLALALAVLARARARRLVLVRVPIHDHDVGMVQQLGPPLEQILAPRAIRFFGCEV